MPDPGRPPRPGFLAQALAILKLSAQAYRNQLGRRGKSRKGWRDATALKHDRKVVLPILFSLMMLGVASNSCYQGVHALARYADNHWPATENSEVLKVGHMVYSSLNYRVHFAEYSSNAEAAFERNDKELARNIRNHDSVDEEAAAARAKLLISHLDQHGIEGFVRERRANLYDFVDLRQLSDEARSWFGRVIALTFGFLSLALILMPLSVRNKDLGATDAQLAWLYCLPLSGGEILSGRFTAATLVKPMTWIILCPLLTVLLWAMGYGFVSIPIALATTLAISLATAGVELAIETELRTRGSFQLNKNVQSMATVLGTLALIMALAPGFAAIRSNSWINWLLDHTPHFLTSIPGHLILMPTGNPVGLVTLLGLVFAGSAACGALGWLIGARSLRLGLSGGNDRSSSRTASSSTAAVKPPSLARFEWLLLMRDRNLATTVIAVPLIMVFYQILVNPELLSTVSAQKIAVFGFGVGVWAAVSTAPHVLLSESNSFWMIFSLPVSIANHFRRRTRVWRTTGLGLAILVTVVFCAWKGVPHENWWRIPTALAGVWIVSLVIYAIMMGNAKLPDTAKGERVKIGVARVYASMLVGGFVGAAIWYASPWQLLSALVLWWFFGIGLWQGVTHRLQYLLEPTVEFARQLSLASAIFAIIIFSSAQAIAAGVLMASLPDSPSTAILVSYTIGGIAALLFCAQRRINHKLPRAEPTEKNLAVTLPATMAVCIVVGWIWLTIVSKVPLLSELYQSAQDAATVQLDNRDWMVVALAVLAAPIIEELIFRGFVLRIMRSVWTAGHAIVANAILFAIVHPALSFPPVFLLGLATAWLYTRTQKVWPGILLHAVYNAAIIAMG